MTDIVSRETRSRMMASIGATNTRPELRVRSYLHRAGLRFRLHGKTLPGRPDLVLAKHKAVVFVHGCFWHRHGGCRFATTPATRAEFWTAKFASNVARDQRQAEQLRAAGWRVFIVFECETRDVDALESLFFAIVAAPA